MKSKEYTEEVKRLMKSKVFILKMMKASGEDPRDWSSYEVVEEGKLADWVVYRIAKVGVVGGEVYLVKVITSSPDSFEAFEDDPPDAYPDRRYCGTVTMLKEATMIVEAAREHYQKVAD